MEPHFPVAASTEATLAAEVFMVAAASAGTGKTAVNQQPTTSKQGTNRLSAGWFCFLSCY
jgi:hypothetical protein